MSHVAMYAYFRPGRPHCEWHPETDTLARVQRHGFHAFAEIYIPHRKLRVCEECALLPRFARLMQEALEESDR